MNNKTKNNDHLEIGTCVVIQSKDVGAISGVLIAKGEYIDPEKGKQKYYKVLWDTNQTLDIYEYQIASIRQADTEKLQNCIKNLEENYGVQCCNENDEPIEMVNLYKNILSSGVWGKFSDEEKRDLVKSLLVDTNTMVELLNTIGASDHEKAELEKRLLAFEEKRNVQLKAALKVKQTFDNIITLVPGMKHQLEYFYAFLCIDELVDSI